MRVFFRLCLGILLLLLTLLLAAGWYLQHYLSTLPLQSLEYRIASFSLRQITLDKLQFQYPAPQGLTDVELEQLHISWQWHAFKPQVTTVTLQQANIALTTDTSYTIATSAEEQQHEESKPALSLPASWQLPDWLPAQIALHNITVTMPCQQQQCQYQATASLDKITPHQWQLNASAFVAQHQEQALQLQATYQSEQQLPALEATLQLGDSLQFQFNSSTVLQPSLWLHGNTQLILSPPEQWVVQQLSLWGYALPTEWQQQFTQPVSIKGNWQWRLSETAILPSIPDIRQQLSGQLKLTASLPSAMAIPGVGWLKGDLYTEVKADDGQFTHYSLQADALLTELALPSALRQAGIATEQVKISLQATDNAMPRAEALPLQLTIESSKPAAVSLKAGLLLNAAPPYSILIQQAELNASDISFSPVAGVSLTGLNAKTGFRGMWHDGQWQLAFSSDTQISSQLSYQQLFSKKLQLAIPGLSLQGGASAETLRFNGRLRLNAEQLAYPQLQPLDWQWQTELKGTPQKLTLNGSISNSASLQVNHQLNWQHDSGTLNWTLEDIFLLAGNPVAATTSSWPALLELNRGRVGANGELNFNRNGLLSSNNQLKLNDISGIYDRTLVKGVNGTLDIRYLPQQLQIQADPLQVTEINHGIVAGPLQLGMSYQATPDKLMTGQLNLAHLKLYLMGGTVTAPDTRLDLSQQDQQLLIQLNQIDLAQLLQQYPSSDLNGSGKVSGAIPITINNKGIAVADGTLAAETPGGQLQYRPEAASGMASNQGMKIILDSLNDFHYSVLSGNVSYDTTGKLILALRLAGSNPTLEQGRPINFNITLEEDLPAMITSLQLSSQISDKIKQRVQQRLQQRREANASAGETP